ncbi:MAG TPA: hypothetical protein DCQ93_02555 [Bacteroidetes bacterium]|nr:hypothetical protein [Bacteroidota bacterium]
MADPNITNSDEQRTEHDLQEAKQNLLTLEALLKMRAQNKPIIQEDDGTKSEEDFDIDPIPGYGGAW